MAVYLDLKLTLNKDGSVTANWNAIPGAVRYSALMRQVGKSYAIYNETNFTGTSYTSKGGLEANKQYRVSVVAYGSSATLTSEGANIIVPSDFYNNTPLDVPQRVQATADTSSVTVSFDAVSRADSYDILFDNQVYNVIARSKKFTGLQPKTTHTYAVRAKNSTKTGAYSITKSITTSALLPSVPTGIKKTVTETSATISWGAVSGATSYDLLFDGKTYRTTGNTYTVAGLNPGTSYSYQVCSNNANGSSSYGVANTVSTIPNPPVAPADVSATSTMNSVTITWNAVPGATGYDVQLGDDVYRESGTSKTITGLRPDTSYNYRVRAINAGGNSAYSPYKAIKTPMAPPAMPSNVRATPLSYSVTVYWNAVSGATSYELWFNGTVYSVTDTSKTVTGLRAKTSYNYQVRARNSAGVSAYSAAASVTTLVSPPAIPSNVSATATANSVTVSWSAVVSASSYSVLLGDTVYNGTSTFRTITGLEPGTDYTYAVSANNAGGSSGYSDRKTIRTLLVAPAVPQIYAAITDEHSVEFAWNKVPGADSYELLFDGTVYEVTGLDKKFEGLEANTEYIYRIRAKNEVGTSDYSAVQKIRTRLEVPENIRAEADAKTIRISFDPVNGATGYDIEFHNGIYDVTETSKVFEGLIPETEYEYAVRAKNEYVVSVFSQKKKISTLRLGPAMPSDITAIATMSSVIISWSPVEGAQDYDLRFDGVDYHVAESGTTTFVRQENPVELSMASVFPESGVKRVKRAAYDGAVAREMTGERIYKIFAGLKPHSRHSYAAKSNNAEGSSRYTAEQYITTGTQKSSGLVHGRNRRTYPDGGRAYMGNDPVNALTGAFLWSYTWLEDYGKDGLHFTTMYDSRREDGEGTLGKKWTHSLQYRLHMDEEYAYFCTPYDDVTAFGRNVEDGSFQPVDDGVSSYAMKANEDGSYSIVALDGTEYVFDGALCLNRMVEGGLVAYRFHADDAGQIIRMEGRHGTGMDIAYADGCIASVTDAMGNMVSFTYEGDRLAAITNPDGRQMSFTYDDACNLLTISDFSGEVYLTNIYDMSGRVTEQFTAGRGRSLAAYDEENRMTSFTDELGNVTSYTYDETVHVTGIELGESGIHNSYNEKGQLTGQVDALGNFTGMEYDEYGRMNRVIYPDGTEECAVYNDRNQPVKVVGRDGAVNLYRYDERNNLIQMQDERGNISSYTYDENDNLISFTDRMGNVWTYAYDENNHLEQATDPDGNICLYAHDAIGRMTSYTSPAGRTVSYRYSATGDLLSIADADGEVVFAYNENGNRTGITDRMGNQQRLEYNEMGQVSLATDCLGNEYRFAYDRMGNLITETDPLGYSVSRTYDAFGNRTSQTDKNGGVTQYYFDAANQLVQVRDAAGGTVNYAYDCMGQVTAVTDQSARQRTYVYDQAGRVLSETDPLGHSVGYTYDEAGNLLTRTDEDGNVTTYTYDGENRLKSIQTDAGTTAFAYDGLGRMVSVTDTDGYTESAEYDSDDNLTAAYDKESRKTCYAYDGMGRMAEETVPDGGKTAYAYDKNGNCVRITDAEGHVSCFAYDANDRLVKATDPLGRETAYCYDDRGQLTRLIDAKGGITEYSYDGNGNLTAEINPLGGEKKYVYDGLNRLVGSTDEEGNTWSCTYDAVGNRTSFTDANGNVWMYGYDANDRLTSVTNQEAGSLTLEYTNTGRISGVTDMEGAVTGYQYDAMGRLIRISDAMGHSTAFTYDSTGRMLTRTDANGNTTEYTYSPTGNLLSVTDPEGNATVYTYNALGQVLTEEDALGNMVSYTYDLLGQVTSMTDALGNTTAFTYTADRHIATVENAEGNVTHYFYDACGNLTRTEDVLGHAVMYEYDAMNNRIKECLSESGEQSCITLYRYDKKGRMVKEINPMLEEKAYGYDGNDNMVSITDEEQRETVVIYDLNNQPVSMTYSDGRTVAFRYNSRGELVEMQDWNGITAMERDSLGRLTGVTDHNGRMTGFTYDAVGNRTGIRYPDSSMVSYAYDRNNRLLTVTEDEDVSGGNTGVISAQYAYDATGSVVSLTQPGSTASYTYNANRQPVKVAYRFGDATSMEEDFSYDVMGRMTGSRRSGSRAEFARTVAYAYDAVGQLISYRNGGTVESYTYDALGNRITRSLDGIRKASCQYNALNQLVSMSEDGVAYSFGYDRCGNLTEERRGENLVGSTCTIPQDGCRSGRTWKAVRRAFIPTMPCRCAWGTYRSWRRQGASATGRCSMCPIS